jgi:hypothetical protein
LPSRSAEGLDCCGEKVKHRRRWQSRPNSARERSGSSGDELAHGPKRVTDSKRPPKRRTSSPTSWDQARADLGIVVSRSNAGGVQAVQWSLPG